MNRIWLSKIEWATSGGGDRVTCRDRQGDPEWQRQSRESLVEVHASAPTAARDANRGGGAGNHRAARRGGVHGRCIIGRTRRHAGHPTHGASPAVASFPVQVLDWRRQRIIADRSGTRRGAAVRLSANTPANARRHACRQHVAAGATSGMGGASVPAATTAGRTGDIADALQSVQRLRPPGHGNIHAGARRIGGRQRRMGRHGTGAVCIRAAAGCRSIAGTQRGGIALTGRLAVTSASRYD